MNALEAYGLGKAYKLYEKPLDSLLEALFRSVRHETFWALRDVSLSVPVGSVLGVVGSNGSGKTTLLQLLAGTLAPTCGTLHRNGRVSAILELGSGFHPDLSGLENIRLSCASRGLTAVETSEIVPKIIEFSELQDFIRRPVKSYSTGMFARLAFSLAISVEPDILVVDEVLSVGDQQFREKSHARMMSFRKQGNTMIFCSHNLPTVLELCEQAVWLRNGQIELMGDTDKVVDAYRDSMKHPDYTGPLSERQNHHSGSDYLHDISLEGDIRNGVIPSGGSLTVRVTVRLERVTFEKGVHIGVIISRKDKVQCSCVTTAMDGTVIKHLGVDDYGILLILEDLPLLAGQYALEAFLCNDKGEKLYGAERRVPFRVTQTGKAKGMIRLNYRWQNP